MIVEDFNFLNLIDIYFYRRN